VLAAMLASQAAAQSQLAMPPEVVDGLTAAARSNLTMARLQDGSPVPPETPEERAQPIVPRALEEQTIDRALLSMITDVCGLDSDALSYLPYMRKIRESARYSDRQIAYIGLLHGLSMGSFLKAMDPSLCTPELIEDLKRTAAEQPVATP
jgi:hypothetical protein